MSYNLRDCLFIAVDVQVTYTAGDDPAVLAQVRGLHEEAIAGGAMAWEVYMLPPEQAPPYMNPQQQARWQEQAARRHRRLLPEKGLPAFGKRQAAPRDNVNFKRQLQLTPPQAVFIYGYYLNQCVPATALLVAEVLRAADCAAPVHIVQDCGKDYPDNSVPIAYTTAALRRAGVERIWRDNLVLSSTGVHLRTRPGPAPARLDVTAPH